MYDTVILPKNSKSEILKLKRYVSYFVGDEISKTSIPCYYIKTVRAWYDLLNLTGIDDNLLKEFRYNVIPTKLRNAKIITDKQTLLILFCIIYFFKTKKYDMVKLFYQLLAVKFYANRVHTHMKHHCNSEVWSLALDNISSKHLYKTKGGIGSALLYLADIEYQKKKKTFLSNNFNQDDFIISLIYNLRHRIQQSFRAFANLYFKIIEEEKVTFKDLPEGEAENIQSNSSQVIANKISILICTYEQTDKLALLKAIDLSGIKKETGIMIVKYLEDVNHLEELRFIIILMDKIIDLKNCCLERNRLQLIRKIEKKERVSKYIVRNQILKLLFDLEIGYKLKNMNKSQLVVFFCHYILLFLKNRIC